MSQDPYAALPQVPPIALTGPTLTFGATLPEANVGDNGVSPELDWAGFPPQTRSFAVTCYDPDAPTASGFWHWAVYDIPAAVTHLDAGAGNSATGALPTGAVAVRNDSRGFDFVGAAPPIGHGQHRYIFAVHAVDVEHLGLPADATPSNLGFALFTHAIGRGLLITTYQR